jgi:cytidylate kinase
MDKQLIIAVDGYSSCGKSTFARAIAHEMNYTFIDSGAMYRTVTLYCMRKGLIGESYIKEEEIIRALPSIIIDFRFNPDKDMYETSLNSENVESEIRQFEVSSYVSNISKIKEVRQRMVELQREIGAYKGIVMDGRDIGTVVFPDADLKIFMTASVDIRAQRRHKELTERGVKAEFEIIKKNITDRDIIDENRDISPLKKADDAIFLDNSNLSVEQQMNWFRNILKDIRNED